MKTPLILSLTAEDMPLAVAGGKGANLARLVQAQLPVPPGFIVTTDAYNAFVAANELTNFILDTVASVASDDPRALEAASQTIRARFTAGHLPAELTTALRTAYAEMGCPAVAVRSSATAEDLPGLSFAGQQDTFLNVVDDEALQQAVVNCWSSLWTARAVGYRARNDIANEHVSLAVIVQEMVPSRASGVLFTANPLSGKRTEMVIDATLGLGEALVSGQVEPDHYVVDATQDRILNKRLGSKALAIHSQAGGGTVTVTEKSNAEQALSDEQILELVRLSRQVVALFDQPQDIEWAEADGRLYLLQSRPITSLYPVPDDMAPEPLQVMFSFGSVQGITDPITPVGRDVLYAVFAGLAKLFGYQFTVKTQPILKTAGERLFVNFSALVNNRIGRRIVRKALDFIDPGASQALAQLVSEDALTVPGRLRPQTALRIVRVMGPMVLLALRTLLRPDVERRRFQHEIEALVAYFEKRSTTATTLAERTALIRDATDQTFQYLLPRFVPRFAVGMASLNLLNLLASPLPQGKFSILTMTRGLPHNVTTAMDLALWQTAQTIRADADAAAHFVQTDASSLAAEYLANKLPPSVQTTVADFLVQYGMRGLAEIDMGRPRWREDPTPVLRVLQSYLQITSPDQAPDVVFARGETAAEAEAARLVSALRSVKHGWVKARLAQWAIRRVRALAGLRESPKFTVVRLLGIARSALLTSGRDLVAAGTLQRPDDLCFLYLDELDALAAEYQWDWSALVDLRRQAYAAERRRHQIPRLLLSDGRAFYAGLTAPGDDEDTAMFGSPVSPGVAEGMVHVVRDPYGTRLTPGEILVCPGTDPSWTPLFLAAGGLITEVGGLMTHGSVVAREYGIPAVVGVHQATERLHTGQRIRMDGTSGRIQLLDR